jgi:uncharacterized membrane protein YecN with MAPEG domain
MSDIDTTNATKNNSTMYMFSTFLEYALNKYMPIVMVCFICFYTFGYETWEPYFIVGLMLFSNRYNFKCGYAHSCLDNGFEGEPDDTL